MQESYILVWLLISGLLFSMITALMLTPLVRMLANRYNLTDDPDGKRKIHQKPMPNIGGIAIVGAFFLGVGFFAVVSEVFSLPADGFIQIPSAYILLGGLLIAFTGLYDDLFNMGFGKKFLMQIAVSLLVIGGGYKIEMLQNPLTGAMFELGIFAVPLTVFVIVGIINAVNLLDGMDGLAAGVTLIAFISLSAAYGISGTYEQMVLMVAISGALIAFLRFNFNPASIFMGDTGSLFLGYLLAIYAMVGMNSAASMQAFLIPVICMGLPVIDTGLAIFRRFLEQRPLFSPDSDHIHHRIKRNFGLTHRGTVIVLYLVSLFLGSMAVAMAVADDYMKTLVLCLTALATYAFLRSLNYISARETVRLLGQRLAFLFRARSESLSPEKEQHDHRRV